MRIKRKLYLTTTYLLITALILGSILPSLTYKAEAAPDYIINANLRMYNDDEIRMYNIVKYIVNQQIKIERKSHNKLA